MTIDGIYYTEPELMAKFRQMQETIQRLDGENYKLTEKLEEIGTAYNEQVSLASYLDERNAELEKQYEDICKTLATAFGCPCNFSPIDEFMWTKSGCVDDCGDIPTEECWNRVLLDCDALRKLIGEEANEN